MSLKMVRYMYDELRALGDDTIPEDFGEFMDEYVQDASLRKYVYAVNASEGAPYASVLSKYEGGFQGFEADNNSYLPDFKKRKLQLETGREMLAKRYPGDFDELLKYRHQIGKKLANVGSTEKQRKLQNIQRLLDAYDAMSMSPYEVDDAKFNSVFEGYTAPEYAEVQARNAKIQGLKEEIKEHTNNTFFEDDPDVKEQLGKTIANKKARLEELEATPVTRPSNKHLMLTGQDIAHKVEIAQGVPQHEVLTEFHDSKGVLGSAFGLGKDLLNIAGEAGRIGLENITGVANPSLTIAEQFSKPDRLKAPHQRLGDEVLGFGGLLGGIPNRAFSGMAGAGARAMARSPKYANKLLDARAKMGHTSLADIVRGETPRGMNPFLKAGLEEAPAGVVDVGYEATRKDYEEGSILASLLGSGVGIGLNGKLGQMQYAKLVKQNPWVQSLGKNKQMEYLAEHAHLEQLARDKNISSTAGAHKIVEARKALELRKAETGRRLDEAIAKLDAGQDLGIPDNIMYESVFHDPHLSGVNKEKVRGLMGSAEVDIPVNFPATLTPRQRELHLTLREVGVDPKEYLRLNRSLRFDNLQGDEFAQWTEMRQKLDRAEIDDKELQEFVELDRGTSLSSMEQFAKNYQNLGEIKRRSAKGSDKETLVQSALDVQSKVLKQKADMLGTKEASDEWAKQNKIYAEQSGALETLPKYEFLSDHKGNKLRDYDLQGKYAKAMEAFQKQFSDMYIDAPDKGVRIEEAENLLKHLHTMSGVDLNSVQIDALLRRIVKRQRATSGDGFFSKGDLIAGILRELPKGSGKMKDAIRGALQGMTMGSRVVGGLTKEGFNPSKEGFLPTQYITETDNVRSFL